MKDIINILIKKPRITSSPSKIPRYKPEPLRRVLPVSLDISSYYDYISIAQIYTWIRLNALYIEYFTIPSYLRSVDYFIFPTIVISPRENPQLSAERWLTVFARVRSENQTHELRSARHLLWRLNATDAPPNYLIANRGYTVFISIPVLGILLVNTY
jgi:hypothetical protein